MAATYFVRDGLRVYSGTSTDNKPRQGVPNGSSFFEMDSGSRFLFDEERREWLWQPDKGGGSSGGGGGVTDHRALSGREASGQHPMSAITGLSEALEGKAEAGDVDEAVGEAMAQNVREVTGQDVLDIWNQIMFG